MASATEKVFTSAAARAALANAVSLSAPVVTTGEDALRVTCISAYTGVVVRIAARRLSDKGEILANVWTLSVPSTYQSASGDFQLGVGALFNLSISQLGSGPQLGGAFIVAQLVRGTGSAAVVLATLVQGYITGLQAQAWPGSPVSYSTEGLGGLRLITGTQPAAGSEILETVPNGARWQVLRFSAQLVTSAAAGVREPHFALTAGPTTETEVIPGVGQNPSVTMNWFWAPGVLNVASAGGNYVQVGVPDPLFVAGLENLTTHTLNLAAGDQWRFVSYVVREWLEVF